MQPMRNLARELDWNFNCVRPEEAFPPDMS
jgi:hypothetical protein